jgi:hypothetical protein
MSLHGITIEQNTSSSRTFNIQIMDGDVYEETTFTNRNGDVWQMPHHPEKISTSVENINNSRKRQGKPPIDIKSFRPNSVIRLKIKILEDADGKEIDNVTGKTFLTDPLEVRLDVPSELKWYPDYRLLLESIPDLNIDDLAKSQRYDLGEVLISRKIPNMPIGGNEEKGFWMNFKQIKINRGYIENDSPNKNNSSNNTTSSYGGGFDDDEVPATEVEEKVSENAVANFISDDDDDLV